MRRLSVLVAAALLWYSSSSFSFEFNSSYYAVYEIPGSYGSETVYIVPKSSFLIVGVDQPTPIMFMPQTTGFKIVKDSAGNNTYQKISKTANDMAALGASPSTSYRLLGGDFDGDGKPDLFLQGSGEGAGKQSRILTTNAQGEPQVYYDFVYSLGFSQSPSVTVVDVDADGRSDIVVINSSGETNTYYSTGNGTWYIVANTGGSGTPSVGYAGSVAGDFDVNEDGAANYEVKILTASGTAGVVPNISLNYSSTSGDGVAGQSWSIGGLSAISRCRQTKVQDGQSLPIKLELSDRFCLDGQRLVAVTGNYGDVGAEYRTEVDKYIVVKSYNGVAGNPQYFTVARKDGSLSYYGNGFGSQQVVGTAVYTWAISRFQDSVGNPIRFSYTGGADTFRINRIDYAYGASTAASGDSATYLKFDYEARPDPRTVYIAGNAVKQSQRLQAIRSFSDDVELRNYRLSYRALSASNTRSFLEKLYECVGNTCLSPTLFQWNYPRFEHDAGNQELAIAGNLSSTVVPIDINGDGKTDVAFIAANQQGSATTYTVGYALSNGSGFDTASNIGAGLVADASISNLQVLDYNNDGFQDLMLGRAGQNWKIYLGSAAGLASTSIDSGIPFVAASQVADMNADGLPDIAYIEGNQWKYRPLNRSFVGGVATYQFGTVTVIVLPPSATAIPFPQPGGPQQIDSASAALVPSIADLNGDGLPDLLMGMTVESRSSFNVGGGLVQHDYYRNFFVSVFFALPGGGFQAGPWKYINGSTQTCGNSCANPPYGKYSPAVSLVDINGDGLPELCALGCWINTANGFGASIFYNSGDGLGFFDYNSDGYLDAIIPSGSGLSAQLFSPSANAFSDAFNSGISFNAVGGDKYISHFDIDGDGRSELIKISFSGSSTNVSVYRFGGPAGATDRIVSIDNGLQKKIQVSYKPLTNIEIYSRESDANTLSWDLPAGYQSLGKVALVTDVVGPLFMVSSVSISAPTAGASPGAINQTATRDTNYFYRGAKSQAGGVGWLGFHSITRKDVLSGVKETTTYRQDYPFIGVPYKSETRAASELLIRSTESRQAFVNGATAKPYRIFADRTVNATYDPLSGSETSYSVDETGAIDDWGNATATTSSIYGGNHSSYLARKQVANSYGNSVYERQFARLTTSTVTQQRMGVPDVVRTSNFSYYGSSDGHLYGLLKSESVVTPDGSATATTEYQYDSFGNRVRTAYVAPGLPDRYTATVYDAGRYAISNSSAFYDGSGWTEQVTESVVSRNAYGRPTQLNGLNGLTTYFQYDALGRETARADNTGAGLTTIYALGGVTGAQLRIVTEQRNWVTQVSTGTTSTEYFDALGRSIAKTAVGFDGRTISSETEYDNAGRVKRQSAPHFSDDTAYWSVSEYDPFGRLSKQWTPASNNTTALSEITYIGLVAKTKNALAQEYLEERNAAGELIKVTDHLGGVVQYLYDAAGQLIQTTNTGVQSGATVNIYSYVTYDQLGRKIKMIDSDKGTWFYKYNVFGDLSDQYKVMSASNYGGSLLDALTAGSGVQLQRVHMDYDRRGRIVARDDYREGGVLEANTTWEYDTQTNGLGLLTLESTNTAIGRMHGYDQYGRHAVTLIVNDGSYVEETEYDSFGRISSQTDALGSASGTQNSYNARGYLESVTDIASHRVVYQVQGMDARGNVTAAILGNNANSVWSFDAGSGLLRTQAATLGAVQLQNLTYTWDVLGNQTSRQDQGVLSPGSYKNIQQSFCYDGLNRLTKTYTGNLAGSCGLTLAQQDQEYDAFGGITRKTGVGTYTYSAAHPRQLASTSDGIDYSYDNVGNMTSDGGGRALHYTAFDKPDVMTKAANRVEFAYGPDRSYHHRVDANTTSGESKTTYYLGSVEKVVSSTGGGAYDMKRYLPGGGLWVHHFDANDVQTGVDEQYLYKDVLGSPVLITNGAGVVKQLMAFNPWGESVEPDSWTSTLAGAALGSAHVYTNEGFTGHDQVDPVGLIHMRGRIYDPRLGRFIQADPYLQDPGNSQSFNRYSYVLNSPLSKIDPTGFASFPDDAVSGCSVVCFNISGGTNGGGKWHWEASASYNQPMYSNLSVAAVDWNSLLQKGGFDSATSINFTGDAHYDELQILADFSGSYDAYRGVTGSVSTGNKFANGASTKAYFGLISGDVDLIDIDDNGTETRLAKVRVNPRLEETMADLARQDLIDFVRIYLEINQFNPVFGVEGFALKTGSVVFAKSAILIGRVANSGLEGANFAQRTFGSMFSKGGAFAGRSVDDVAGALRSGAMKPSEVPIDFIIRDGNKLILNTRSAQALEAAGIPRSQWNAVNRTGQEMFEDMLSRQLQRNGLTSLGIPTVRRSGGM